MPEKTAIVGIDPGLEGGIAILRDGQPPELHIMPVLEVPVGGKTRRIVDPVGLFRIMLDVNPRIVFFETQRPPHMASATFAGGSLSSFAKGRWFGQLEGLMTGCEIPFVCVEPKAWQKCFGITGKQGDTGQQAIVIGQRLFPGVNLFRSARCTKAHDGMGDALLLAEYGRRTL